MELQKLQTNFVSDEEKIEWLACPACSFAFKEELPPWTRDPVYLGQNKWLSVCVFTKILRECSACHLKVPSDQAVKHSEKCAGKGIRTEEEILSQEMSSSSREEELKSILFSFWENVQHFEDPDGYRDRLSELLVLFGTVNRDDNLPGVLLQNLAAVGLPMQEFMYPASIEAVLLGADNGSKCHSIRSVYVQLLTFLRHLLSTALEKGYLPEGEFQSRDNVLKLLQNNARAAILQDPVAVPTLEVKVAAGNPDKFCHSKQPNLCGAYSRYLNSPLRERLLERIVSLTPGTQKKESFINESGSEMLTPVWVRNFLALEVYLRKGTTAEAVTACTLDQFQNLFDHHSRRQTFPSLVGNQQYHWLAALGDSSSEAEVLNAQGIVARAICSYVRCLRPAFFKGQELLSTERLPLFPLDGGHRMRNLVSCMYLFFKFCGGKPNNLELSPSNIHALKEDVVKET